MGRWDHTGSEGTEWSPHTEQRVFCAHQAPSPHWDPRTQPLRRRDEPELRASFPAVGIPQGNVQTPFAPLREARQPAILTLPTFPSRRQPSTLHVNS